MNCTHKHRQINMLHSSTETPQCIKVGTLTQKYITLSCQKFVKNKNKTKKKKQDAIEIRKNLSKWTAVTESVLDTIYIFINYECNAIKYLDYPAVTLHTVHRQTTMSTAGVETWKIDPLAFRFCNAFFQLLFPPLKQECFTEVFRHT